MFTISEMFVLLWLVPVAINIILPLSLLGFSLIGRLFGIFLHHDVSVEEKEEQYQERHQLSTAGN